MTIFELNDPRLRWASAVALGLIALMFLLYVPPLYGAHVVWIYDIAVIVIVLLGGGLCLALARAHERGEVLFNIWASLGIGLLLWAAGEATWAYFELIRGEDLDITF